MSNAPKDASEKAYQENFVAELAKFKWQTPDFLDGNKHKVTVQTLIDNWRSELNRLNNDQLEGIPLTDDEFAQVMSKVGQISNSYAVSKLNLLLSDLVLTLPEPSEWAEIKDDDKKEEFKQAFFATSDQMNLVQQYYEYQWNDESFGMTEHTWLQYIGAYKNLFPRPEGPGIETPTIRQLQGKTKLTNTQVIDAAHILSLIGARVGSTDGIQTVDEETKRIIYEQIQELSNMGEAVTAELLREFVEDELFTGHLSSSINFDEAFDNWKKDKLQEEIEEFADFWGIQDKEILIRSVYSYSESQPEIVPYIEEINNSVNLEAAQNKDFKGRLRHIIELGKILPNWMQEVKSRLS